MTLYCIVTPPVRQEFMSLCIYCPDESERKRNEDQQLFSMVCSQRVALYQCVSACVSLKIIFPLTLDLCLRLFNYFKAMRPRVHAVSRSSHKPPLSASYLQCSDPLQQAGPGVCHYTSKRTSTPNASNKCRNAKDFTGITDKPDLGMF